MGTATVGDIRREAGLSQSALGARLGLTQVQISRLEQGRVAQPRRSTVEGYRRVLKLSEKEFQRAFLATRSAVDIRVHEKVRNLRRAGTAAERMELPGLVDEFGAELVRGALSDRPRDWSTLAKFIGTNARAYTASASHDEDGAYVYAVLRAFEQLAFSARVVRVVRMDSDPGAAKKWESWLLDIFRYADNHDVHGVESSSVIAFSSLLPVAKSDRDGLAHLRDQLDGLRVRHTQGWTSLTRRPAPLAFRAIACADVASAIIDSIDAIAIRGEPTSPATPTTDHAPAPALEYAQP